MAKKNIFKPSEFTPTEFTTAEEKARFANHFVRFVQSDFKETFFFNWFYEKLSHCFGHIAHYDRSGFYRTFFRNHEDKAMFLVSCRDHRCDISPKYSFSDVERALQLWIDGDMTFYHYFTMANNESRNRDLHTRDMLLRQYPLDQFPIDRKG